MSQHDEQPNSDAIWRGPQDAHRTRLEPDPYQMNAEVLGQKEVRGLQSGVPSWEPRRGLTGEPLAAQPADPTGPTRASTFPEDAKRRKEHPVASGVLDYFPDAIVAIAHVSWAGNEQHNAGQPLHWARNKSTDEADALMRHFLQRGSKDSDGIRHSAKMAWRSLALLQKEIEAERNK